MSQNCKLQVGLWPALRSLLRTVLENPVRAEAIKHIRLDALGLEVNHQKSSILVRDSERYENKDRILMETAIRGIHIPDADGWYRAIDEKQHLGATMSLLSARCLNLEALEGDIDLFLRNRYFPEMLRRVLSAPRRNNLQCPFDEIARFSVTCPEEYEVEEQFPTDTFLLLFYLPKLANLAITAAPSMASSSDFANFEWPLNSVPIAVNLTTMSLQRSPASPSTLGLLLRQTPALRSLLYDCQSLSSAGLIDLYTLQQALSHVRSTLCDLVIRFDVISDEALDPENLSFVFHGNLGSLRDFTSITSLNISFGALYGQHTAATDMPSLAHVLPPNIERLTINDDLMHFSALDRLAGDFVMSQLKTYFEEEWKSATPRLAEFELDLRTNAFLSHEHWRSERKPNELRALISNQGIKCLVLQDGQE
ncbi:hypothetical protein B0J11DRAFT_620353 [Dendryphion nanum]|uniref:F-box domain-containing protein n=1 Tax=Dendryphion nanum TaxID=256645 RepID=A0A9P9CXI8_9PLEO|nr:hypothetical protein B0J11DRAFT_620353 [Dendryphion nanum]